MLNTFLHGNLAVKECPISGTSWWAINVVIIVVLIPLLNQCLYPYLREYTPSMLKRIGIAYFMIFLTPLILLLYEGIGHHASGGEHCIFLHNSEKLEISSWLLLLPIFTISVGEVFISISSTG